MPYPVLVPRQAVSRSTKVLFVLPSLSRGGAEVQTVDLVNGLSPDQFEKCLVTFEKDLAQKERIDTESVYFSHFPRRSRFDRSPPREIARLIDERQIDVVYCSLQIAFFIGWLAVSYSNRKPKLIVALHTTLNRRPKDELFDRLLYQWLMRSCTKVVCVCHAQEKHWQRKFPFLTRKTQVIYNGVDTEQFNPAAHLQAGKILRKTLGISEHARVVCNIAGFRPEKGHSILVEAFKILERRNPDAFLLLVGDGALRPEIEEQVRESHLTNRIHFLGNLADVRPALAASDCSVIASTAETFSIAMLESLAMEVPLVATRIGGTAEAVLHGQTGLLIPAHEALAMADALWLMLDSHSQRQMMGAAGRELVKRDFSAAKMINEMERMLSEVAANF